MMLLAVQEGLYLFPVIHFCITIQSNQSNCNSIVLLRSVFASIFTTLPSLIDSTLPNAVVQLVVSIDFISVRTFG